MFARPVVEGDAIAPDFEAELGLFDAHVVEVAPLYLGVEVVVAGVYGVDPAAGVDFFASVPHGLVKKARGHLNKGHG